MSLFLRTKGPLNRSHPDRRYFLFLVGGRAIFWNYSVYLERSGNLLLAASFLLSEALSLGVSVSLSGGEIFHGPADVSLFC